MTSLIRCSFLFSTGVLAVAIAPGVASATSICYPVHEFTVETDPPDACISMSPTNTDCDDVGVTVTNECDVPLYITGSTECTVWMDSGWVSVPGIGPGESCSFPSSDIQVEPATYVLDVGTPGSGETITVTVDVSWDHGITTSRDSGCATSPSGDAGSLGGVLLATVGLAVASRRRARHTESRA
jgi:MYXO-CTERM domain-containing protein